MSDFVSEIRWRWMKLRYVTSDDRREWIAQKVAHRLPRSVVYWAVIRAGTATLLGDRHPDQHSLMDVLNGWDKRGRPA